MRTELAPQEALDGDLLLSLIAGEWTAPAGEGWCENLDPAAPGEPLLRVARASTADGERALGAAVEAGPRWRETPAQRRGRIVRRAAELISERRETIAEAMVREEGKLLAEARAEVGRTAEVLEVVAGLVHEPAGSVFPERRAEQWLLTKRAPLGVVAIISPWNFPLLIPAWKLGPALLAGNTVVVKPAELAPITAAHLVQAFVDAGLPPGTLNLVHGRGSVLGPALLRPPTAAVSFTGGNVAGGSVAQAAAAHNIRSQLELGGSNPVLVLADADLERAAAEIVAGATSGSGQKCTATRRVFVAEEVLEPLVASLRSAFGDLRIGPGIAAETDLGPLVSAPACEEFEQAAAAIGERAELSRFGEAPADGFYALPGLALGGDPSDPVLRGEIFGPLVSLFPVAGLEDGIRACNDTPFGLSASLFTSDLGSAMRFCSEVDAGMLHVNSQTTGAEPHLPFGGTKASSSGSREVGRAGFEFFSEVKSIYMEPA